MDMHLLFVSFRSLQTGYILYRLLRHVILQPIVRGLNNIAYKNKWQKEMKESSSEVELNNRFENIPQEILELILQRLPLNDYLCFGTVCSSWRFVVANVIAKNRFTPAPELPLLMFCGHPYTNSGHCFLCLSNDRVSYKPNTCPQFNTQFCSGSCEGWLIMSDLIISRTEGFLDLSRPPKFDMVENFFFNPVSKARIMLPPLTTPPFPLRNRFGIFLKVNASAAPTSANCIVVAIRLIGKLMLCRLVDKSWTQYKSDEQFTDAVFHDGKLYAITESGAQFFITVIDLREFSKGRRMLKTQVLVMLPTLPIVSSSTRIEGNTVYTYGDPKFHLVKDHASDDLLMIMHISDHAHEDGYFHTNNLFNYTIPPRIKSLILFKLDRSGPRWVQVDSLGDQIVFISPTNCIILSAASISKYQKEEFTGNCIYFALDYPCLSSPQQGRDVGVFCLADGSIKRNFPSVPRLWFTLQPVWFIPNPW